MEKLQRMSLIKAKSSQLDSVLRLHEDEQLREFILGMDPTTLETSQMLLQVLAQIESSYYAKYQKRIPRPELHSALESLIKDSATRLKVVRWYQAGKLRIKDK